MGESTPLGQNIWPDWYGNDANTVIHSKVFSWYHFSLAFSLVPSRVPYLASLPLRRTYIFTTNHRSPQAKEIKYWHAACCSVVEVSFTSVGMVYRRPLRATPRTLLLLLGCLLDYPRRFSGFWDGCRRQEIFSRTMICHFVIQLVVHFVLPSRRPSC